MTLLEFLTGLNPFQTLSLTILAGLLVLEVFGLRRDPGSRRVRWVRILVWLAAGVAITWPGLTTDLANLLGIGRGADLVFYLFGLVFLGVSFFFYSRLVRLQRQITQLIRDTAIREARYGDESATGENAQEAGGTKARKDS
jgi:hypothetical protein